MAVVSSTLTAQTGGREGDYVWKHARVYLIHTDTATDGDYTVVTGGMSASPHPLPALFAVHPENANAHCKSVTAQRKGESRTVWEVTAQYDSQTGDGDSNPENPELIPPEIQWSTVHRDRVVFTDIYGDPVTNSIGQQFDEPVLADDNTLQLNITVHRFLFDGGALDEFFMNRTNEHTFYGGRPGTVKLSAIQAVPIIQGTTLVWKITFEFHYRRETWVKRILNRGIMHMINPDGSGEPVQNTPLIVMNLKMNGQILPKGQPIPELLYFVYKEADFGLLGVGS